VASKKGHEEIGRLLLEHSAKQELDYEIALDGALEGGHKVIVLLLLDRADMNEDEKMDIYAGALHGTSRGSHKMLVQLLLNTGAAVWGSSVEGAATKGHEGIVRLLLDELDEWPDDCNALHAASMFSHEAIVKLLLDKGADINAEGECFNDLGEWYGTALQVASFYGCETVVRLLLGRGADVHAQGGEYYGTALQAASTRGYQGVM
jgi:hypothetical protein